MPHYNQITIIGHLGRDPEFHDSDEEKSKRISFSIAVNKWKKDAPPDWFNVTAWGMTATRCNGRLKKGDTAMIVGSMESYKGKDDAIRWSVVARDIIFLSGYEKKNEAPKIDGSDDIPF